MTTENLYCVILAGGKGRRLWPCSRPEYPKQFIDFFGTGRTQVQQTFDHLSQFMPADHILVSTHNDFYDLVREQLPLIPEQNILAEPIWRNTAPSVAWATHRAFNLNPEAVLLVMPSDHQIIGDEPFCRNLSEGAAHVEQNDDILVLGVKPTRPEPGYGYIQLGDQRNDNIYKVQSFTEKPEREFARMFMESGEFYWNTGMLMGRATTLRDNFMRVLPAVFQQFDRDHPEFSIEAETEYINKHFPSYPNVSMEQGVLEKAASVSVIRCDFGWADLGTWHSIYESEHNSPDDNVVLDSDVILDDSTNNLVKMPHGHTAIINGLHGYIVVEHDDILLICPKEDSSSLIRKYSVQIGMR